MVDSKVLIAVPTAEMGRQAVFYDHFNSLKKPDGTGITFSHGQSPARNRNLMIDQALNAEHGFTHILFLDDDLVIPPDLLTKLLSHDKDIVTGLYLMRNFPHQPILFEQSNDSGQCLWYRHKDEHNTDLVEVVSAGLGCCLIKTSIFSKLEKPYVRLGEIEVDHWCDDLGFFKRVREANIKIYCDLSVQCGHMATVIIRPEYKDGAWFTTYDTHGTSKVSFPSVNLPYVDGKL